MKLLALFLACSAFAATTTVTQVLVAPDGTPAIGTAYIRISAACRSGTSYVGSKTVVVKFAPSGSTTTFSVGLVPNDTCTPSGTSYTVSWLLSGGQQWTETWVVPTSGTAVSIDSVVVTTTPTPTWAIQWAQVAQGGAVAGQAPLWSGTAWLPGGVARITRATSAPSSPLLGDVWIDDTTTTDIYHVRLNVAGTPTWVVK